MSANTPPMRTREIPWDMDPDPSDPSASETGPQRAFVGHSEWRPVSPLESLMQTAPHSDPATSRQERLPLRDVLADAIDMLSEEERWIFDALFVRRASLRALGRELSLSKTGVARKRDRLLDRLREHLGNEQIVKEYLDET